MLEAGDIISVNEDQAVLIGMVPGEYVLEEFSLYSLKTSTQDGKDFYTVPKSWEKEGLVEKVGEKSTPLIKVGDKVEVVNYKETGIRRGVYEVVNRAGSLISLEGGWVMKDSWVEKGFIEKVEDDSTPTKQGKVDVDDEYVLGEQGMLIDLREDGDNSGISEIRFSDEGILYITSEENLFAIEDVSGHGGKVLLYLSDIDNLIKALELSKKLWGKK